ncbi:hypothetical protein PMIN01_12445 [Paraphaeosphaeria minitans]|uniref:Uncharacterized protein n=1 Tax=Paraphaeosphaeria minitans TaxID=565426 RepID=A0A9P6KKG3_9PLEO|nr:hypothetical protein PMIN01_12445 [Paraphaeosphaeria minitans]
METMLECMIAFAVSGEDDASSRVRIRRDVRLRIRRSRARSERRWQSRRVAERGVETLLDYVHAAEKTRLIEPSWCHRHCALRCEQFVNGRIENFSPEAYVAMAWLWTGFTPGLAVDLATFGVRVFVLEVLPHAASPQLNLLFTHHANTFSLSIANQETILFAESLPQATSSYEPPPLPTIYTKDQHRDCLLLGRIRLPRSYALRKAPADPVPAPCSFENGARRRHRGSRPPAPPSRWS